ncbi:MAG: TIGR01212 family radical SAM protein, partial [Chitinispirillaceae bacterium]|nr:TIGR01212 family radical SAM protein [Chitinispirillaceae bacterium]
LPYLQPFSNTYGSVEMLKEVYEPLLSFPNVVGLAIGTRPDCFTEETYDYLYELSKKTYLSVELGLQTIHNSTLQLCNRGHTFEDFEKTVRRLSELGIECVAHVILGLPTETEEMMLETAKKISELPCAGVKIHQLMIIKGTEFEKWYLERRIKVFELDEYSKIVSMFISFLRPDQHIHRIMSDSNINRGLIAPLWSAEKNRAILKIYQYMKEHNITQGSRYYIKK